MSYNPEPCYCEQACEYEDALQSVADFLAFSVKHKREPWEFAEQAGLIIGLLQKYRDAQTEYEEEG